MSGGDTPTAVCVLGMSRSGTSLTARLLNLAGVYLGPDEELLGAEPRQLSGEGESVMAKARRSNPGGHWEHYRLMRLNERILRALGGNWREPPPLPPGWESSPRLDPLREEARALLAESFGGRELWGWKDPRNSLTLPFWQALLPSMRCVVCVRSPLDVARSLERRDAMPVEHGLQLWLGYLVRALVNTSGHCRLLVSYESYFGDAAGAASRLARFAGCDDALDAATVEERLAPLVQKRLWRNRTPLEQTVSDSRMPAEAVSLHLLAELLASPRGDRLDPALEKAVDGYAARLLETD